MAWLPVRALSYSTSPPSHLLQLPAELRAYIFELAVTSDKTLVTFHLDKYQEDTLQEATQPSLTQACKQLRSESLLLFFNCNTFVVHTEGKKAETGYQWARCNKAYLSELLRVSLWQRDVTATNTRSESNGAICVSLERSKAGAPWRVADQWSWVTVTRKPAGVSIDAGFIMGSLRRMIAEDPARMDTADDLFATIIHLRSLYTKQNLS